MIRVLNCLVIEEFREVRQFVNNARVGIYIQLIEIPQRGFDDHRMAADCVRFHLLCCQRKVAHRIFRKVDVVHRFHSFAVCKHALRHDQFFALRGIHRCFIQLLHVFRLVLIIYRSIRRTFPSQLVIFLAPTFVETAYIYNVRNGNKFLIAIRVVRLTTTVRVNFGVARRLRHSSRRRTPTDYVNIRGICADRRRSFTILRIDMVIVETVNNRIMHYQSTKGTTHNTERSRLLIVVIRLLNITVINYGSARHCHITKYTIIRSGAIVKEDRQILDGTSPQNITYQATACKIEFQGMPCAVQYTVKAVVCCIIRR